MSQPLARVGQRFTAQFVDGLAALAAGAVFYFVAKALALPLELAILGWLLYLLLCDGLPGGQSLGKRLTRTSVVHVTTEEPCTYWQSCVRNFTMVLGVFDAAFIIGKQRRRLGDHLGRTKVVQLAPFE
jgi:hypothetical protein